MATRLPNTFVLLDRIGNGGVNVRAPCRSPADRTAGSACRRSNQTDRQHHRRRQHQPCNLAHSECSLFGFQVDRKPAKHTDLAKRLILMVHESLPRRLARTSSSR